MQETIISIVNLNNPENGNNFESAMETWANKAVNVMFVPGKGAVVVLKKEQNTSTHENETYHHNLWPPCSRTGDSYFVQLRSSS